MSLNDKTVIQEFQRYDAETVYASWIRNCIILISCSILIVNLKKNYGIFRNIINIPLILMTCSILIGIISTNDYYHRYKYNKYLNKTYIYVVIILVSGSILSLKDIYAISSQA